MKATTARLPLTQPCASSSLCFIPLPFLKAVRVKISTRNGPAQSGNVNTQYVNECLLLKAIYGSITQRLNKKNDAKRNFLSSLFFWETNRLLRDQGLFFDNEV